MTFVEIVDVVNGRDTDSEEDHEEIANARITQSKSIKNLDTTLRYIKVAEDATAQMCCCLKYGMIKQH